MMESTISKMSLGHTSCRESRPCSYSGVTTCNVFFFTEAHNASKYEFEGYKSSVSASLTLGWTPSRQTHQRTKSSRWHCRRKAPSCRPMAKPCSSKLYKQVFNLCHLFFLLSKKDLNDGTTRSEERIGANSR